MGLPCRRRCPTQDRPPEVRWSATKAASRLHIFEEAARTVVRYLGRFIPDPKQPHYREDALDVDNQPRTVIVFRLWPVDNSPTPPEAAPVAAQTMVFDIPIEANNTTSFPVSPTGSTSAHRREAALVERYCAWLANKGISTSRKAIRPAGQSRPFYTDLFNDQTKELIEAKGTATRDQVRLALGQILDYARYISPAASAILLPVRPAEDLISLLTTYGVSCIYETPSGNFDRVDA